MTLVAVAGVSSGEGVSLADDFEDGDTAEYREHNLGGELVDFHAATDHAFEGSFAGKFPNPSTATNTIAFSMPGEGLGVYPSAGDEITVRIYRDATAGRSNIYFGIQDLDSFYKVRIEDDDRPAPEVHLQKIHNGEHIEFDVGGTGLPDNSWETVTIDWGADGTITVDFSFTSYTLKGTDTLFTDGGFGYGHQIGSWPQGAAWFDLAEVGTPVPPPEDLGAEAGPQIGEVTLDWTQPSGLSSDEIDHYTVYRAPPNGDAIPIGTTQATSFVDPNAGCYQEWVYEVTVTTTNGTESSAAFETVKPFTPTDLLCRLNQQYDFYWGPRQGEMPLADQQGPPDAAPTSLDEIRQRDGQAPYWYLLDPVNITCCSPLIEFDTNDLLDETEDPDDHTEVEIRPGPAVARALPGGVLDRVARTGVEQALEFGDLDAATEGLRGKGIPRESGQFGGQATTPAFLNASLTVNSPLLQGATGCTQISGQLDAGGGLVLEHATNRVDVTLQDLFVQGGCSFPGPSYEREFEYEVTPDCPFGIPCLPEVEVEAEFSARTDLGASGMLGGRVDPSSLRPEILAGGVGASAKGHASVLITGGVDDAVEAEGFAGAQLDAPAKSEVFTPLVNDPAPIESPYTGAVYSDLDTPVLTVKLGPVNVDAQPIEGSLVLFGHSAITQEFDPPALSWDGTSLVFGRATVSAEGVTVNVANALAGRAERSQTTTQTVEPLSMPAGLISPPTSLNSADDVADWVQRNDVTVPMSATTETGSTSTDTVGVPANATSLVITVEGEPGSVHDVTIQRPVGHHATETTVGRETFGAGTWQFTIPNVEIGPNGTSVLTLDTVTVQEAVKGLTRNATTSFDTAKSSVNVELDTNGDGDPDRAGQGTPHNPAVPTTTTATVTGRDAGPGEGYLGEPITLTASVRTTVNGEVPDTANGTRGDVTFRLGNHTLGTDALNATGQARLETRIPVDVDEGSNVVRAEYSGVPDQMRASRGLTSLAVEDRPPVVNLTQPEATAEANRTENLTVRFHSKSIQNDVVPSTAEVRIDDNEWRAAREVEPGVFGTEIDVCAEEIEDAFHNLTVRFADAQGREDRAQTSFVVDCHDPYVAVTPLIPATYAPDGRQRFTWNASEPMAFRANVSRVNASGISPVETLLSKPVLAPPSPSSPTLEGLLENTTAGNRTQIPVTDELEPVFTRGFREVGELVVGPLEPGTYVIELSAIDTAENHPEASLDNPMQPVELGPYVVRVPDGTI